MTAPNTSAPDTSTPDGPSPTEQIDPRGLRFIAAITTVVLAIALLTGNVVVLALQGIAFAGGAAFSSEEGYFATKVMRGLGLIHLEQQARV